MKRVQAKEQVCLLQDKMIKARVEILTDATETFRKKRHGDSTQTRISIKDTLSPLPGAMNRWGLPVQSPRPPKRDRIPEGEQPIYASIQLNYTRNRIHLLRDGRCIYTVTQNQGHIHPIPTHPCLFPQFLLQPTAFSMATHNATTMRSPSLKQMHRHYVIVPTPQISLYWGIQTLSLCFGKKKKKKNRKSLH